MTIPLCLSLTHRDTHLSQSQWQIFLLSLSLSLAHTHISPSLPNTHYSVLSHTHTLKTNKKLCNYIRSLHTTTFHFSLTHRYAQAICRFCFKGARPIISHHTQCTDQYSHLPEHIACSQYIHYTDIHKDEFLQPLFEFLPQVHFCLWRYSTSTHNNV